MPSPVARRAFLGRSCVTAGSLAAVAVGGRPAGGFFVSGSDLLRVGLVGCGGRGTGAAAQAAAADPGVRITALADLFPDRIDAALAVLDRTAATAIDCPADRRFTGEHAWRRVVAADVDVVILATSPDARPAQAVAAVTAGRHVYCEAPAAIDAAGVAAVQSAFRRAEGAGLSVGSGLAWRHDPDTVRAIASIRAGLIGPILTASAHSRIGPAWRTAAAGGMPAAAARREWITSPRLSGGDFVEHHVHAIDKLLWALGDEPPVLVEPLAPLRGGAATAVRYRYADDRAVEASLARRPGGRDRIAELVTGARGGCDLRAAGAGAGRHARSMAAFVRSVRGGPPVAEGDALCRSTLAAILGRDAAATAAALAWPGPLPA